MNINQLHNKFNKTAAAGLASALVTNNDPEKDPASRAGDMWQGALTSELGADTGGALGFVLSQILAKNAEPKTKALAAILGALGGYAGGGILGHKASKALAANRDKKREELLSKSASAKSTTVTLAALADALNKKASINKVAGPVNDTIMGIVKGRLKPLKTIAPKKLEFDPTIWESFKNALGFDKGLKDKYLRSGSIPYEAMFTKPQNFQEVAKVRKLFDYMKKQGEKFNIEKLPAHLRKGLDNTDLLTLQAMSRSPISMSSFEKNLANRLAAYRKGQSAYMKNLRQQNEEMLNNIAKNKRNGRILGGVGLGGLATGLGAGAAASAE